MNKRLFVALHPGLVDTPAVDRALALAKRIDADVMLYSAVYDSYFTGLRFGDDLTMQQMRDRMLEAEQAKLERIRQRFEGVAKSTEVLSEWHYPAAEGIVKAAGAFRADLIIVSSSQHSVVARLVLTNTDWAVLRDANSPVLLAHPSEFSGYKTVMAAVDPTHAHDEPAVLDHALIAAGRFISEAFDGELHLGHAYPSARTVISADYIPPADMTDHWRKVHLEAMNKLADTHGIKETHMHLLDEHPRVAIPALAEEIHADLVVMGVVSRSLLQRLVIGRTAEYVLDHLPCDVLTVRVQGQK